MKIDETTISILKQLKNGRISYRKISTELGISENTIRYKVNQMKEEELIDITGLFDPEATDDYHLIFMAINFASMKLVEKAKALSQLQGVIFTTVVTGRFDILMQVLLKKDFGLLDFYTNELSQIDNIRSVETFVVYKGFNLKVPFQ